MITLYTPPKIRANVASSLSTDTKVSSIHWYSYYWYFVYRIEKIFRTEQGDCFLVLHFVKMFVWDRSVFTQYSSYFDFFRLGPALRLCDRHRHVWVHYFNTTKITVWCMLSILMHMNYFSVYTISISEHYRAIVSYSPTPGQQVSTIFWNITITVWLQSQVHCVTYYFVLMHDIFTSQNTGTHYTVIILSYQARSSELQVVSRY